MQTVGGAESERSVSVTVSHRACPLTPAVAVERVAAEGGGAGGVRDGSRGRQLGCRGIHAHEAAVAVSQGRAECRDSKRVDGGWL
jgi:hypothetical protein